MIGTCVFCRPLDAGREAAAHGVNCTTFYLCTAVIFMTFLLSFISDNMILFCNVT